MPVLLILFHAIKDYMTLSETENIKTEFPLIHSLKKILFFVNVILCRDMLPVNALLFRDAISSYKEFLQSSEHTA